MMSDSPAQSVAPVPLSYASPASGTCPVCCQRPVSKKTLYGRPVCKKCLYKFANRRQLAYLVDTLILIAVAYAAFYAYAALVDQNVGATGTSLNAAEVGEILIGVALNAVFFLKDGFNGQSPGKKLTGVQVIDLGTGKPISFGQSFKRNLILGVGLIPFVGVIASLAVIVLIIIQMTSGPRVGDGWARTRVIWLKYNDSPLFGGAGNHCGRCQYDLTGNASGQCPECGTPVPA